MHCIATSYRYSVYHNISKMFINFQLSYFIDEIFTTFGMPNIYSKNIFFLKNDFLVANQKINDMNFSATIPDMQTELTKRSIKNLF